MPRIAPRAALALLLALFLTLAACRRDPAPGVTRELAEQRAAAIHDLRYAVHFELPAERDSAVAGSVTASFRLTDASKPLVFDFRAEPSQVLSVERGGEPLTHRVVPDHIVIPASALDTGLTVITIRFASGDAALNRNEDFLYALFVPDRASTAFPVFEQPDLKARFSLTLGMPAAWRAVSNGALMQRDSSDATRHRLRFADTAPISTYLFSFAAGNLQELSATRDGRSFTMYHRETDVAKLRRNAPAIFDLHAASLRWLEAYTGIAYPFAKFDFFAIPSFQFGGMEHPGAIWYNAGSLFLDESAGRAQELGRASLIAHETAHMWFGDLVTMRWFNDVWMKEVFANFMAAKVVGPSFPDVDLQLRFFQAHHPSAYGVDRTPGANAIRQQLENQREAGSLYGAIIYQKAPIVMQQLETLVGDSVFREGIRTYLQRYQFGNATWPELVEILDALTPQDLASWSRVWVEEPGRPTLLARLAGDTLIIEQHDTWPDRNLRWPQRITYALGTSGTPVLLRTTMQGPSARFPLPPQMARPRFLLGGADGVSYGRFVLDSASRTALLTDVHTLPSATQRAVAWQALHEELLAGALAPQLLLDALLRGVAIEREELIVSQQLGLLRGAYWRYLDAAERLRQAPEVERTLWNALDRAPTPGRKGAFFSAIVGTTLTPEGTARLERIWRKEETPRGLPLSETQYTSLAEALAVRGVDGAEAILDAELARIANADRRQRLEFIRPALSADPAVRDAFFRRLANVEQRRRESWVLDALSAMHHPLRGEASLAQVRPALEMVEEIQRTGDIFFPLRWTSAVLDGHRSPAAADTLQAFLAAHPRMAPRLRGKVLQAGDGLMRAAQAQAAR
jgi:aminopeptidase N